MLRIPHCLDKRLTDGGKVVSLTHRPYFTPQKHYYFNVSSMHFCWRLSKSQGLVSYHNHKNIKLFFFFFGWSETEFTIIEAITGLLYQPRMMMDDYECGAIGGMICKGNRSTRRKHAPVTLCSPQIPHNLTRARTRTISVKSRRLTAWATSRK
jgi:hypothetical protein